VDDLGPAFAHGTLDVEANMVHLKKMFKSRKNFLEGFARMVQYEEQVFWWTLTQDKLEIPPAMRREFTWAGQGEVTEKVLEAHLQPLDTIIGLWKAEGLLPALVTEWLAFFAAQEILRAKGKSR